MTGIKEPIGTLHFVEETIYKAEKALVAAKFLGVLVNTNKFDVQKDAKNPSFLAKNPTGKVPFLETDRGVIFTSNSIARFIARSRADSDLYGRRYFDEGQIDSWLEFCTYELEVPLMSWVYPTMGLMEDTPQVTLEAQADVKKALTSLEEALKSTPYLIGDFVTLADIVLVCALREGFARVLDPTFRKPFPKVTAWFERCCALPQFKAVFGTVKLCSKADTPKPVLPAFAPPVRKAAPAPAAKTAEKPKAAAAAPKAEAKAAPKAALAPKATAAAPAGGGDDAAIKAKGDEIRALKEKLKAEGMSGKKIDADPNVQKLVAELQALKAAPPAAAPAPKAAAAPAPAAAPAAGGDQEALIKAKGDEIRALKESLKAGGLSGKKIDADPNVQKLVAELQALKSAPAAAAPAPAPAPAAAPAAPAAGGDQEALIKAKGDEIRALKDKLKAGGMSGKKVDADPDVQKLVAELQALKAAK